MITVKLLGGLCNQMFQAAYALSLTHKGYQVQLDKSALVEGTHREYSLGYFGIEAGIASTSPNVYENGLRYNPRYLEPSDPSTMIGYWQSEKYFLDNRDKIREVFRFKGPMIDRDSIAVHVRRQDYVGLQHFHGLPSIDYYREAIAHIRSHAGRHLNVLVFSDDRRWCQENFPPDCTIMAGNKYEDLALMSSCDYAVIANSSFSWWGAWLSRQRMVVAPSRWFSDPSIDYSDIVPDRWVKL